MLECDPAWSTEAMIEYEDVVENNSNLVKKLDNLHAFCCAHASKESQKEWCD